MATDIAFALAVLAVVAAALPTPLRAFLLTLAIVDDLGAILVIAVVFTESIDLTALLAAVVLLAAYAALQHLRLTPWWLTVPLALALWVAVHESGVHATVAGVALGLLTRVRPDRDERHSPAERLEHLVRPVSAGVAVPVFALFAAGVRIDGDTLRGAASDAVAVGVVVALVAGKFVGVFGGTWLTARLTRAELSSELRWADIAAVALLSGIGFTVSLLIGELSFPGGDREQYVTLGVLAGSLLAAALAALVLRRRARWHGRATAAPRTPD
jgi:NhaA family Na+:H+ antiporter